MNYSSDVYVNTPADTTTTVPSTTTTPTTPTTTPTSPTTVTTPQGNYSTSVSVLPGWHINQWIDDLNKQGYHITYDQLVAANPGLVSNINWIAAPNNGTQNNAFKSGASYTLPASALPPAPGTMTSNV